MPLLKEDKRATPILIQSKKKIAAGQSFIFWGPNWATILLFV